MIATTPSGRQVSCSLESSQSGPSSLYVILAEAAASVAGKDGKSWPEALEIAKKRARGDKICLHRIRAFFLRGVRNRHKEIGSQLNQLAVLHEELARMERLGPAIREAVGELGKSLAGKLGVDIFSEPEVLGGG